MALGNIGDMEQRMIDPDSGVPINSYGQYLIPDPKDPTGKRKGWQRASTLAGMLADKSGLETWKLNTTIVGMGRRPDLRLISTTVDPKNRDVMRMLREQSFEAGGGNVRANEGTGFHGISDIIDNGGTIDLGEDLAQYSGMVAAYRNLLIREQIEMPEPEHRGLTGNPSELVVLHPGVEVAGRFDKIRKIRGRNCIVDVKTGQDPVRYSELEYAMQLAVYAHCPNIWYESVGQFGDMPPVDKEVAYVAHVPAGGDYAELIAVDIAMAWRYVLLALQVRASRKAEGFMQRLGRVSARDIVTESVRQPGPIQPSMMAAQVNGLPIVAPSWLAAGVPASTTSGQQLVVSSPVASGNEPLAAAPVLVQNGVHVAPSAPQPDLNALLAQYQASAVPPVPVAQVATEQSSEPESGKRVRKCSRCKRPGHQARTCPYVSTVDGSPIIDQHSTDLIASGKAADSGKAPQPEVAGVTALSTSPQQGTPELHADAPPAATPANAEGLRMSLLPTDRCTCTPDHAGFTRDERYAGVVYVHATCGLPAYAPSMAAVAFAVTQMPGQDPATSAMATQAVQHFTNNPTQQPSEGETWPPAYSVPATSSSAPAHSAGGTSTPAPAPSPGGGSSSPSTASGGTPVTVPPATAPPTPPDRASSGSTPPDSSTPAHGSAAHGAEVPAGEAFSVVGAAVMTTDRTSWPEQLKAATDAEQVGAIVQAAQAAGEFDQALAMLAGQRMWELRPSA